MKLYQILKNTAASGIKEVVSLGGQKFVINLITYKKKLFLQWIVSEMQLNYGHVIVLFFVCEGVIYKTYSRDCASRLTRTKVEFLNQSIAGLFIATMKILSTRRPYVWATVLNCRQTNIFLYSKPATLLGGGESY